MLGQLALLGQVMSCKDKLV